MTKPIRRRLKAIGRYIADLEDPRQTVASRAQERLLDAIPRLRGSQQVVVDLLLAATAHPDPHVRYRAVSTLGATRSPRAYPTILAMVQDPDERVRYDAAVTLGSFGYVQAVESLIDLVRQAVREDSVDSAAAMALARLGEPAVPPLLELLQTGSPKAKAMAARTLGSIGDPAAIEPIAVLLTDADEWVRIAAVESLAQIGERSGPGRERCLELIATRLDDPVQAVRDNAAYWYREVQSAGKKG
jgi:HEAT repeat protein